jgi:poly(hydroxyalkanoate) depolymerase family esterase
MSRYRYLLLSLGVVVASVLVATAPAQAATLTQIASFGSNPGNLAMYSYRPDGLPSGRPLVVLLHGCTQDAATYFANSGWRKYADLYGFQLVLPQTSTANNSLKCFTWFDTADINRDQGEALSIRTMVGYAVSNLGADPARVYVSGLSAGGAMSAVMLATYPDVFAAGSIAAGIPYKCATSSSGTSACQYSGVDKTPQQWGDLVRAQHGGPYPRVAIWQGQSDTTVVPKNGVELVDQWTNLRGVSQTPTSSATLTGGATVKVYGDNDVRLYEIANTGHGLPVDPGSATDQCGTAASYFLDTICSAYHDSVFFGLTSGSPPPSPSSSPSSSPTPTPSQVCVTASNYAHTQAGRAHVSFGYAYANGSNQLMGLWNVYTTTTLRQTGPNYWVIGC